MLLGNSGNSVAESGMSNISLPQADMRFVTIAPSGVDYRQIALGSLSRLPPFSPVLNRLLATIDQEDVSFAEIANLIEKDAVLTGQILRLVNSAAFGRRATINSVGHAVSLLGVTKIRNSVLGFSISRLWSHARMPDAWSSARFNLHSVATAILADLLAQRAPVEYPEGAFVAGVLHDLGQLVIALALPDKYMEIREIHACRKGDLRECERAMLGFSHEEIGAAALERWSLPEPIRDAVRHHHRPTPIEAGVQLSHLLCAADVTVNQFGISILPGTPELDDKYPQLVEIGVGSHLSRILLEFHTEFDAIRSFF
jgi:HD-like signal output (HDOD) protein